jgi:hypothetical protein
LTAYPDLADYLLIAEEVLDAPAETIDPEHKIEHRSELEQGGHFAAMEAPDVLIGDIHAFRPLR